jgi:hypothetical protein
MAYAKLISQFFIFLYFLSMSIFYFNMLFVFLNKEFLLAIQEFILLMNSTYQFIQFLFLLHVKVGKKGKQIILIFTRASLITRCCIFGGGSRFYLLLFAVFCHEALVADVGEEKTLVDGDVGSVLVGGVGGAHVGVPFPTYVGIAALFLVVSLLLLLLSPLVVAPVTITRHRTFCNKMTGLTTFVAHPFGTGLVIFPLPLLEDLAKALDDERHFLVVKLRGVDGEPTRSRLFFLLLCRFECDGSHLGCGGTALLQVDDLFGAFDHQFKAHKLSYHFLGRH